MKFKNYYLERPSRDLEQLLNQYNNNGHKTNVWNALVDSGLVGVNDDDLSIFPRILPASYWPTLKQRVYLITKFVLKLLSLPEREIRAIIPEGPVRDHLLNELEVLKFRTGRITGSFRYDMALVGPLDAKHPPYLLEINEIGFDGLARSTFFQNLLLKLIPELKGRVDCLDTAAAEVRNMQRLGKSIARIQFDDYNWDEEVLHKKALQLGSELRLISPSQFKQKLPKDSPLLEKLPLKSVKKRIQFGDSYRPDAVNFSFAYELKDYLEAHSMYRSLVESKTPQYGPFLTGLIASKTILVLFDDPQLRRKLLGGSDPLASSILPAHLLSDSHASTSLENSDEWVLKYTDGCGGEQVYMNEDLLKQLRKIPPRRKNEWVLQKKVKLNLIQVNGILSRSKQAISDLGVFVQYDWQGGKFRHFEIGGLMCRANNRSLKVNVSSGGLQVAVMLDKAK